MPLTIRGVNATVRWGYYPAAVLRAWTVTRPADGPTVLAATVVSHDAFRLSQQPLALVATHATGAWRWPIHELQMVDGALTARLGPREVLRVPIRST